MVPASCMSEGVRKNVYEVSVSAFWIPARLRCIHGGAERGAPNPQRIFISKDYPGSRSRTFVSIGSIQSSKNLGKNPSIAAISQASW
jgi:hypothetical protein